MECSYLGTFYVLVLDIVCELALGKTPTEGSEFGGLLRRILLFALQNQLYQLGRASARVLKSSIVSWFQTGF